MREEKYRSGQKRIEQEFYMWSATSEDKIKGEYLNTRSS